MFSVYTIKPGSGCTRTLLAGVSLERAHACAREHVGLPADALPTEIRDGLTYYRGPSFDGFGHVEPGLLTWVENDIKAMVRRGVAFIANRWGVSALIAIDRTRLDVRSDTRAPAALAIDLGMCNVLDAIKQERWLDDDGVLTWAYEHGLGCDREDLIAEALNQEWRLQIPAFLEGRQISTDAHDRLTAIVEEGIREGQIHQEGSAEAYDARKGERFLREGRLFAACRAISGLLRNSAWDELRDLAWASGAPVDVFSWDNTGIVTAAPSDETKSW